jgi:hypothetical protein
MKHRSKEGETKAKIIDAVIAGNDSRAKLKAFFKDEVSRKDLNFHLSKNNNGLRFEHVLSEQNGKISLTVKTLDTIFRTVGYLIKLPKYKDAFDMAFAECFYSGFGESPRPLAISDYPNVAINSSEGWLRIAPHIMSGLGKRVPSCLPSDTRMLFTEEAIESFEKRRGNLDTVVQLSYISTVLRLSKKTLDPKKTTLANATSFFNTIPEMIRQSKINYKITVQAIARIVDIANKRRETFLDPITKYEKVLMMLSYVTASLYNWKVSDAVSKLAIPSYNMMLDAFPHLQKLYPKYFKRMK